MIYKEFFNLPGKCHDTNNNNGKKTPNTIITGMHSNTKIEKMLLAMAFVFGESQK